MDVAGKKIVIIADSHADIYPFGKHLERGLEALGAEVTVLAIGGSAAPRWLYAANNNASTCRQGKCVSANEWKGRGFDLAIIALGTNDAANTNRYAVETGVSRAKAMQKAAGQLKELAQMAAPQAIWIGPPKVTGKIKWYTQDAIDELYAYALPLFGDAAIDSRPLMPSPLDGDGVHLGKKGYRTWADGVLARFSGNGLTLMPSDSGTPEASSPSFPVVPLLLVLGVVAALVFTSSPVPAPRWRYRR